VAIAVWIGVAVIVVGRGILANNPDHAGIYTVYARGGADWAAGRPVYPAADGFEVFRYHPLFAAAFAPLGVLPVTVGSVLWRAFLVGMVFSSLRAWLAAASGGPNRAPGILILVAPLVAWDLVAGQTNALIAALLLRAVTATGKRKGWTAATWLAVATLLKLFPLGFAALLIVVRPRLLSLRFVAMLGALSALPFALQNPVYVAGQYADWMATVTADTGRHDFPIGLAYRDVRFLFRVWTEPMPDFAFKSLAATCWLVALVGVRLRRHDWRSAGTFALAWGGVGMTLFGPCTEIITYAILGPTLAAAAWDALTAAHPGRWVTIAAYDLLAAGFIAFLFPFGTPFAMCGPHPAAAVLFVASGIVAGVGQIYAARAKDVEVIAAAGHGVNPATRTAA
jgi:hypothetical protein